MYHALGYGTMMYLQATLTFEMVSNVPKSGVERIIDILKNVHTPTKFTQLSRWIGWVDLAGML